MLTQDLLVVVRTVLAARCPAMVCLANHERGDTDVVTQVDRELALENERLRRENRILGEERDILKKATQFFASQKP